MKSWLRAADAGRYADHRLLKAPAEGRRRMAYELVPALTEDKEWLERLRRDVYQELFKATFGGWDEVRHVRQFAECWERGRISIITVDMYGAA